MPVVDLNHGGRWQEWEAQWADRGVGAVRSEPTFYRHGVDGPAAAQAETATGHGWAAIVAVNSVRGVPWVGDP